MFLSCVNNIFPFLLFCTSGFPTPAADWLDSMTKYLLTNYFSSKLIIIQYDFVNKKLWKYHHLEIYRSLCALASFPNYLQLIWAHFQFCNPRYFQIRNPNAPSAGQWSCRRRNSLFPFRISIEMLRTSCATGRRPPLHFHFATDLDGRHWGIRRIWTPALEVIR